MPIVLSGSLELTGSVVATGNFTTTGNITAQTLVVQTITSSIVNITGSNIFGSRLSDTQTFTGSVLMTGSLIVNTTGPELQVNNNGVILGNLLTDNHSITGSLRVTGSVAVFGGEMLVGATSLASGFSTFAQIQASGTTGGIVINSATSNIGRLIFTNNNTSGGEGLIRYNGCNQSMEFWTNATQKMSISCAGAAIFACSVRATSPNITAPTLGVGAGAFFASAANGLYGLYVGTSNDTGNSWVQNMRNDGAATAYGLSLQPSGGNVGIGVSNPSVKLDILGNNEVMNIAGCNSVSAYTGYYYNTSTLVGYIGNGSSILSGAASSDFIFRSQGALVYATCGNNERMRITGGGIIGINGAPSAWASSVVLGRVIQIDRSAFFSYNATTADLSYNIYFNGSDYKAIATDGASLYRQIAGKHEWYVAGSTSAGATAPLSLAMNITTAGASQFDGPTLSIGSQGTYAIQVGESGQKHLTLSYKQSCGGYIQTWQSTPMYLNSQGNAVYAGSVRLDTLSDQRVKDSIQPIEGALNKILSITGKKFHLKDEQEGKLRYGFIAQELEGILDEFVINTNTTFKKDNLVVENVKSIENWASSWSALLVEAMKEQQCTICSQASIINTLKTCIGI